MLSRAPGCRGGDGPHGASGQRAASSRRARATRAAWVSVNRPRGLPQASVSDTHEGALRRPWQPPPLAPARRAGTSAHVHGLAAGESTGWEPPSCPQEGRQDRRAPRRALPGPCSSEERDATGDSYSRPRPSGPCQVLRPTELALSERPAAWACQRPLAGSAAGGPSPPPPCPPPDRRQTEPEEPPTRGARVPGRRPEPSVRHRTIPLSSCGPRVALV